MNIIELTGESSCKGQENGDASTSSERPLKKARYAWQVKGKYHLKNETNDSNKNLIITSAEHSSQSSSATYVNEVEGNDNIVKQDYTKLDSLPSANSLLSSNNSLSKVQQHYPRYLSTYEKTSSNIWNNRPNSVRTVSVAVNAEDQCIARWQARQVEKGCLDNTLNRVLESWTTTPFPVEEANHNRFLALDFAEFINHLPGDNSVENEGILMAISAHGLQNTSNSSSNYEADNCNSSNNAYDIPSTVQSLSAVVSDDDSQQTKDQQCNTGEKSPRINWQCENQDANDATPFAYFSEPSKSPYNFSDDSPQNSNIDTLAIDNHYDFMNAAVLYAIQSKGLTASGTDYG